MNAYGLFELAVVGLIVAVSAWSVVRPWLRKRTAATAKACGTQSSSCGGCSGCGSEGTEQPVRFHR